MEVLFVSLVLLLNYWLVVHIFKNLLRKTDNQNFSNVRPSSALIIPPGTQKAEESS